MIATGRVTVAGTVASKAATAVGTDAAIVVRDDPARPDYASRGGHKLAGALDSFGGQGLTVTGRRCLDAGASTGGFTDVLLRRGAAQVVAVDVGYGQLAWRLREDDRVVVLDRTNVRDLTVEAIAGPVDLVVADLSFVSLTVALPALTSLCDPAGDQLALVKPQFEVGRQRLGRGVVRDPALRAEAVATVSDAAAKLGWGTRGVVASTLPGSSGNVEYFLWLRRGGSPLAQEQARAAVEAGPSGERVTP